ncbi:MAG: type II secretion system secretin GspD [Rhodanobacteraceae bacterium]|jgi:general secretion pathway protein D|nr:type II secretion system secretin GspD [Rhodanobacteraceae bacterium]
MTLLIASGIALLAGCATPAPREARQSDVLTADTILKPAPTAPPVENVSGIQISSKADSNLPPPKPEIQVGTGQFFTPQAAPKRVSGEGQVTFNFENQPIQAVVKAILGDMLQENYTIAPNVGGNVTYSTSRPIRREDAMPVLEMLLSWTGNALVNEGGRYTVLQAKDAIPGKLTPRVGPSAQPGYALRIYPLRYISASQMATLLKPYAKADAFVSIDPNRSLLVLAGTPSELDNYARTIDTFDVDWLKGMSVGVFTLQHVEVTKLLPDLQKIFGTEGESPLAGMFRFMPIEQTNAMVVITPQKEYLKQAEEWLYRLDRGGAENTTRLYVYNVKNLKAPDLADYLSEIFLGTTGVRRSTSGGVAPGLRPTTLGSRGGQGGVGGMSYQNSLRPQSMQEKAAPAAAPAPAAPAPAAGAGGPKETDIRISAIEENNQLMIQATPLEWDRIESAIKRLDVVPLQVQIEARILEVSLTGNLSFGVQWYLNGLMGTATGSAQQNGQYPIEFSGNRWNRHRLALGANGNVAPTNDGGFFYSFLSKNFEVAINALESSGTAKSLAAPSLLVMNNQEAQINVGQQIPVVQNYVTGIGIGTNSSGNAITPGYGSVQYLNTGVILNVKPRVNPGGLVYLDIQQEVSNPPAGYSSGSNTNPAISQRQIQTQVAVQSGETLMLGGLIRDNRDESARGLPFVSRVPVLRNLFGSTTQSKDRTELIVLITPRVIANVDEAREATLEYTRQFESLTPLRASTPAAQAPQPAPTPAQTYPIPEHAKPEDQPRDH